MTFSANEFGSQTPHPVVPIVYSPRYNVTAFGLERLHPFDGRKYGRIRDWLVRQGLRRPRDFVAPAPVTD